MWVITLWGYLCMWILILLDPCHWICTDNFFRQANGVSDSFVLIFLTGQHSSINTLILLLGGHSLSVILKWVRIRIQLESRAVLFTRTSTTHTYNHAWTSCRDKTNKIKGLLLISNELNYNIISLNSVAWTWMTMGDPNQRKTRPQYEILKKKGSTILHS